MPARTSRSSWLNPFCISRESTWSTPRTTPSPLINGTHMTERILQSTTLSFNRNRLSLVASAESIAVCDDATLFTRERLSRRPPFSSAFFSFFARKTSLFVFTSLSKTNPRSTFWKISNRPSKRRGNTSSSESDAPRARFKPITARNFASAFWLIPSSADGRGMSNWETIIDSSSCDWKTACDSSVSPPSDTHSEGVVSPTVKTNRSSQTPISSAASSRCWPVRISPLRIVPFRLPRSSTHQPPSFISTAACWRLTEPESTTISQPGWRPMIVFSLTRRYLSPALPPVINTRNDTVSPSYFSISCIRYYRPPAVLPNDCPPITFASGYHNSGEWSWILTISGNSYLFKRTMPAA